MSVCPHCAADGVVSPLFWPLPGLPSEGLGPWDTDFSVRPLAAKAFSEAEKRANPNGDAQLAMRTRTAFWAHTDPPADTRGACSRKEWRGLHRVFQNMDASRGCACRGPGAAQFAKDSLRLGARAWGISAPRDKATPSFGLSEVLTGRGFLRHTTDPRAQRGRRDPGAAEPAAGGAWDPPDLTTCPTAGGVLGAPSRCGGCLCSRFDGSTVVCPAPGACCARLSSSWGGRAAGSTTACACHSTRVAVCTDPVVLLRQVVRPLVDRFGSGEPVGWDLHGVLREAASGRAGSAGATIWDGLRARWDALEASDGGYRGASTEALWEWLGGAASPAAPDPRGPAPPADPNTARTGPSQTQKHTLRLQSLHPPLSAYLATQDAARAPGLTGGVHAKLIWALLLDRGVRPMGWALPGAAGPWRPLPTFDGPYSTIRTDGGDPSWEEQADELENRDYRAHVRRYEEEGLYQIGTGVCRVCKAFQVIGPPQPWRHKRHGCRSPRWDVRETGHRGERPRGWYCAHCEEGGRGAQAATFNKEFELFGDAMRTPKRAAAARAVCKFLNAGLAPAQMADGARGRPPYVDPAPTAAEPARKRRRVEVPAEEPAPRPHLLTQEYDAGGQWMRLKDPQLEADLRARNQGVVEVSPGLEGDKELRYPSRKFGDIPVSPSNLTHLQRFVCNLSDAERQVVARFRVHGVMVRVGMGHGGPVYKGGTVSLFALPETVSGASFPTLPEDNVSLHVIRYQRGWCSKENTATYHPALIFRPTVVCLFLAFMAEYGPPEIWGANAPGRDPEAFRRIREWSLRWGEEDLMVHLDHMAGRGHYRYNLLGNPTDRPGVAVELAPPSIVTDVATPARTECVSRENLADLLDRGSVEVAAEEAAAAEGAPPPTPVGASFRVSKMLWRRAARKCRTRPAERQTPDGLAEYYRAQGKRWHTNKAGAHAPLADPQGTALEYLWQRALRLEMWEQGTASRDDGKLTQEEEDALKADLVAELEQLRAERMARGEEVLPGEEGGGVQGTTGGGGAGEPAEDGQTLRRAVHMGYGSRMQFWENRHPHFCAQAFPDLYLWSEGDPLRPVRYRRLPEPPDPSRTPAADPGPPPETGTRTIAAIDEVTKQGRAVCMSHHFNLLLRQADARFLHHLHTYWIFAYQQKLDLWAHAQFFLADNNVTENALGEALLAGDPDLHRKLRREAHKIRGVGKGDPHQGEERLRQTSLEIGSPSMFFTMSAFDHNHPFYQWVALRAAIAAGDEPPDREVHDLTGAARPRYAVRYAYQVNEAILHLVHCYLHLFFMPYLGAVRMEVVVEFQHRGAPHIHALIWTREWSQLPQMAHLEHTPPGAPPGAPPAVALDPDFERWHDHLIEQRFLSDKHPALRHLPWNKLIPDAVDPTRFLHTELAAAGADPEAEADEVYNEREDFAALQMRTMQHTCKVGVCLGYDPRAPLECRMDFPMALRARTALCRVGRKRRVKLRPRCNKVDLIATCYPALLAARANCNLQLCTEEEATMRYVVKYMRKKEPHGRALVNDWQALRALEHRRRQFNLDQKGVVRSALRQSNAGREYTLQECCWWISNHPISLTLHNLPAGTRPPRVLENVNGAGGGQVYYNKHTRAPTRSHFDRWVQMTDAVIDEAGLDVAEVRQLGYLAFRRFHAVSQELPRPVSHPHDAPGQGASSSSR